ncbi:hypothetical protein MKX07_005321 [Trichoderma sp. CBMAI-0711]|uniref:DUF1275 domain protein n=1 Tax=Trichoderma parareesei TaxID=858221 RepID=A0A2H2YZJ2_TRIPA|nr:hypothetical protein MKX07_005321 [Trichoderma sp. CBMAI-0711]OTA01303.1 hypothetical protein A9Z42_0016160 [Trichoderma parareesei]
MAETEDKVTTTPLDTSREGSLYAGQQTPQAAKASEKNHDLVDYFSQDIRTTLFVELQLLLITFCTGIQDATTFPDYHCFASNQTGNTIFLCLALIIPQFNGDMFYTANIGTGLGVFLVAGWLTGQVGHIVGPRKRWWLILCNLIQTGLVFAATGIQYRHGVHDHGWSAVVVVALLAFAAGSQVVQSRSLAATEISTAMATAAWVDLMIDQKLFVLDNRPRTRRVAFLLALVVGGLVGALIYRTAGSGAALAVSGAGKGLAGLLYIFSGAEKKKKVNTSEV